MIEKWEYKIIEFPIGIDNIQFQLNILGLGGWELVVVKEARAYFKRRIAS